METKFLNIILLKFQLTAYYGSLLRLDGRMNMDEKI